MAVLAGCEYDERGNRESSCTVCENRLRHTQGAFYLDTIPVVVTYVRGTFVSVSVFRSCAGVNPPFVTAVNPDPYQRTNCLCKCRTCARTVNAVFVFSHMWSGYRLGKDFRSCDDSKECGR